IAVSVFRVVHGCPPLFLVETLFLTSSLLSSRGYRFPPSPAAHRVDVPLATSTSSMALLRAAKNRVTLTTFLKARRSRPISPHPSIRSAYCRVVWPWFFALNAPLGAGRRG